MRHETQDHGRLNQARATGDLREDHRLILEVVAALEHVLNRDDGSERDLDVFDECVQFFRLFVDACHHGKEEDLLFDELGAVGMPRSSGPIGVMLAEHRQGRALVATMGEALKGIRAGHEHSRAAFHTAAQDYVDLIRGHIAKEDGILFQHADNILSGPACDRLCAGYERVCAGRFDGCTKAELKELADRVMAHAG